MSISGIKSKRAWWRRSEGKGHGVRHSVQGVTCRGRGCPQFGQLFLAVGVLTVLYGLDPPGSCRPSLPAAAASLIVLSACVHPVSGSEQSMRPDSYHLTCNTIGLSIISSRPSTPLSPSAPRSEDDMSSRICSARAMSAQMQGKFSIDIPYRTGC
jgi:hypothetical protein